MLAALFLVLFFVGDAETEDEEEAEEAPADAFAGGFPVPPMPAGGPVRGAAQPLVFEKSGPTTAADEEIQV